MLLNVFFWIIIAIFIGIIGFIIESNQSKNLLSNIVAAFIGSFLGGFLTYFFFYPDTTVTINGVAGVVAIVFSFISVNMEDYVFSRPKMAKKLKKG